MANDIDAERLAETLSVVAEEAENIAKWVRTARALKSGTIRSIYLTQSGRIVDSPSMSGEEYMDLTDAIVAAITDRNNTRLEVARITLLSTATKDKSEEEE